jgi:hypothetical protein
MNLPNEPNERILAAEALKEQQTSSQSGLKSSAFSIVVSA